MKELVMESYGKVNLALDVLYKREDGYHEINSVMQQISLKDTLIFSDLKQGIVIESDSKNIPLDENNLVHRAWLKLKEISNINRGIHIRIEKNIPVAAGLAGGSSNCATTLVALNQLWNLGLSMRELMDIGVSIGADIPFCLLGGTAKAQGIGEVLTKLKPFKDKYILLGNPGIEVSTLDAYKKIDLNKVRLNIDELIKCMEDEDLKCVAKNFKNAMEPAIIKEHPIISQIKDSMLLNGALGALMSGSGPTVFGLFDDQDKMLFAKNKLLEKIDTVYNCITI